MLVVKKIVTQFERIYSEHANPEKAQKMSDYMKGKFQFYGLNSANRRAVFKEVWPQIKTLDVNDTIALCYALYESEKREDHYNAVDILMKKKRSLKEEHMKDIEFFITQHSWWDTVDLIASNVIGHLFKVQELRDLFLDRWAMHENFWLRRVCIIFQIKYKQDMDLVLIFALVEHNKGSKEFFINKAGGWALRQASKFFPNEVRDFVEMHPDLHTVTLREARKYI